MAQPKTKSTSDLFVNPFIYDKTKSTEVTIQTSRGGGLYFNSMGTFSTKIDETMIFTIEPTKNKMNPNFVRIRSNTTKKYIRIPGGTVNSDENKDVDKTPDVEGVATDKGNIFSIDEMEIRLKRFVRPETGIEYIKDHTGKTASVPPAKEEGKCILWAVNDKTKEVTGWVLAAVKADNKVKRNKGDVKVKGDKEDDIGTGDQDDEKKGDEVGVKAKKMEEDDKKKEYDYCYILGIEDGPEEDDEVTFDEDEQDERIIFILKTK